MKLKALVIGLLLAIILASGGCKIGSLVDEGVLTAMDISEEGDETKVVFTLDAEREYEWNVGPNDLLIFIGRDYEDGAPWFLYGYYYVYVSPRDGIWEKEGRKCYTLSLRGLP